MKNRNIGIFTLYPRFNYGGILQCVALYSFLKENGYNPILIQGPSRYKSLHKEFIKSVLENIPFQNIKGLRINYKKECFHKEFIDKNIPNKTKRFLSQKELYQITIKYNLSAVVVGSDQVWRIDYIKGGYYQNYFLDFVNDSSVKRIAYAASFGKKEWTNKELNTEISSLLRQFDAISVREASGVDICNVEFNINGVHHVLDPTLLVESSLYDTYISQTDYLLKDNLIVTYILDSSNKKTEIVNYTQKLLGDIEVFNLNECDSEGSYISIPIWLKAFKQAKFIITDSFHGMIFSIIFNKPFLVIGNEGRGLDRFTSFLSKIGLEERLIFESNYIVVLDQIVSKDIFYNNINDLLILWRRNSSEYLLSNLLCK